MSLQPCSWCIPEDQFTCPECNGNGFVEINGLEAIVEPVSEEE